MSPTPIPPPTPLDAGAFGAALASRRAACRLSLREVAARAEFDPGQLSRIERGQAPPPWQPDVVGRLGGALGFDDAACAQLGDLAALAAARVPPDLYAHASVRRLLPLVFSGLRRVAAAAGRPVADEDAAALLATTLLDAFGPDADPDAGPAGPGLGGALADAFAAALDAARPGDDGGEAAAPSPPPSPAPLPAPAGDAGAGADAVAARAPHRAERARADAERLQAAFDALVAAHPPLGRLVSLLPARGARAVVFGGWARDHIAAALYGRAVTPGDLDLVVEGLSPDALGAVLEGLAPGAVTRNVFDGFAVRLGDPADGSFGGESSAQQASAGSPLKLDVWPVQTTYTFVRRGAAPSLDALPATTVFTMESVVFKPRQWWGAPALVEAGFYDSLDRRELALQRGERPFPAFQLGRALQYAAKLGLRLAPDVLAFARDVLRAPDGLAEVKRGVRAYGHPDFRPGVLRALDPLRTALSRATLRGAPGEPKARPIPRRRATPRGPAGRGLPA